MEPEELFGKIREAFQKLRAFGSAKRGDAANNNMRYYWSGYEKACYDCLDLVDIVEMQAGET